MAAMPPSRQYWLFKSEPSAFSIEDLRRAKARTSAWDGVRNYQARNFLRDAVRVGDGVLFYHSNTALPGIAGEAAVTRAGYADPTAFDAGHRHFDPKSRRDRPTWYLVDVRFVRACRTLIPLDRLRTLPALRAMMLLRRGARLSIQPVTPAEWAAILALPEW